MRTLHTKSVAGMSSGSWALLCANVTAWGLYGLRTDHWPLVVTSALALIAAAILLGVARHFRKDPTRNISVNPELPQPTKPEYQ